jgi:hypothetical protein
VNSNLSVNTGMTEKEIEQKFRAISEDFFLSLRMPLLAPAT